MMPGRFLHRLARRLLPTGACESVLEPLLADLQHEWQHPTERLLDRAWRLAHGYWAFWVALGFCGVRTMLRGAVSPVEIEAARPAAIGFAIAACGIAVLRYAVSSNYRQQPLGILALGQLSTLGFSVVFAMVPAFMYARPQPHRAWNPTTSRLLIAGIAISIVCVGWVGPAFNGAHEHALGHFLDDRNQPAFASLPSILRAVRSPATADPLMWRQALNGTVAMIVMALLLGLIGWQLSAFRPPSPGRALAWWFGLMEFVLASGSYAIRITSQPQGPNTGLWWQWLVPGLLIAILLTLRARASRAQAGSRPT
jgi:hypothetical protein